jgi:hypothetical protein
VAVNYTPNADYNGPDSFVVQVADGNGGTAAITVNVSITPVNDAPRLDPLSDAQVTEGSLLTFILNAQDVDADTLTFSGANLPAGALLDAVTGTFTWTPPTGSAGTYPITFTVTDNGTPVLSDSQSMTIEVRAASTEGEGESIGEGEGTGEGEGEGEGEPVGGCGCNGTDLPNPGAILAVALSFLGLLFGYFAFNSGGGNLGAK